MATDCLPWKGLICRFRGHYTSAPSESDLRKRRLRGTRQIRTRIDEQSRISRMADKHRSARHLMLSRCETAQATSQCWRASLFHPGVVGLVFSVKLGETPLEQSQVRLNQGCRERRRILECTADRKSRAWLVLRCFACEFTDPELAASGDTTPRRRRSQRSYRPCRGPSIALPKRLAQKQPTSPPQPFAELNPRVPRVSVSVASPH